MADTTSVSLTPVEQVIVAALARVLVADFRRATENQTPTPETQESGR